MAKTKEFIKSMKTGYVCIRIPIAEIADYYDAAVQQLRDNGLSAKDLDSELQAKNSLRGICPSCVVWTDTVRLGMASLIRRMGRGNVTMTNYGATSRILDGLCLNHNCPSKEILLIWKNEPTIEKHLNETVQRIEKKNKPVQQFLRPDIMAYTVDSIFALRLHAKAEHRYIGKKFSDVFVWVSVIPNVSEDSLKKYMFPQGYCKFFNGLLRESGYDSEYISVIHWVYIARSNPMLHLSFLLKKSQATPPHAQPGCLVIPIDLLNAEEQKELGLLRLNIEDT